VGVSNASLLEAVSNVVLRVPKTPPQSEDLI
jgi:hypothetical protein